MRTSRLINGVWVSIRPNTIVKKVATPNVMAGHLARTGHAVNTKKPFVQPVFRNVPVAVPVVPPPPAPAQQVAANMAQQQRKKKKTKPPPPNTTEEIPTPIQSDVASSSEAVEAETKEEKKEEKEEKKKHKMKKWPENPSELLPYKDIANPLKDIIRQGYRLWRKDDVKAFEYEGYNIGKHELQSQPPPNVRLSAQFLEHEKKSGYTLLDVVMNIMFLQGVEQGRRAERKDIKPVEMLLQTLEIYREKNKNQRIRIDELEVALELKNQPNLSEEDFKQKVKEGVAARRKKRIAELKDELKLDASRSTFQFKTPPRAKFKELETLAKSFSKETCTEAQWKHLLHERGWTSKEWKDICKKKNINIVFS